MLKSVDSGQNSLSYQDKFLGGFCNKKFILKRNKHMCAHQSKSFLSICHVLSLLGISRKIRPQLMTAVNQGVTTDLGNAFRESILVERKQVKRKIRVEIL